MSSAATLAHFASPAAPVWGRLRASKGRSVPYVRGVQVPASPALVRTVVPAIVGTILAFLASHNIHVSAQWQDWLTAGLSMGLTGLYYVLASLLQSRWPLAGLLLGSTARPTYTGRHRKTSALEDPATATSDSPPADRP